MKYKKCVTIVSLVLLLLLAAGIGVLVWWLMDNMPPPYTIVELENENIGQVAYKAALTRIPAAGDIFWWFYPTLASGSTLRPIILWLDGVAGVPPSMLANFALIGPYDFNMNRRMDSWVDDYNLLFVDAPMGTGFSTISDNNGVPKTIEENIDHLMYVLESFYSLHEEYNDAPLFIYGQGHGAQLALSLAIRIQDHNDQDLQDAVWFPNLKKVIISNGFVAPVVTMSKIGFYLEEMGYIGGEGREAVEALSAKINNLVNDNKFAEASDNFLSLGSFINLNGGTVAVNLGHIVEKLYLNSNPDFGQQVYLESLYGIDLHSFMKQTIAPLLGLDEESNAYDAGRTAAHDASRDFLIKSTTDKVDYLLENTTVSVSIINGNLDAISNTPGQWEWINKLQWSGLEGFKSSARQTLVVDGLVQGYFRKTDQLQFYWINAAGQSVVLDSPKAMRRVIDLIISHDDDPDDNTDDDMIIS